MSTVVYPIFLYSHILAGIISLVVAPLAMVVAKGGRAHRRWGMTFVYAMTWVFVSAVLLALVQGLTFLLMIAVFSYYNVVSGYRYCYLKRPGRVRWYDWAALSLSISFNGYFLWQGLHTTGVFGILSIVFATVGLLLAAGHVKQFAWPSTNPHMWFFRHISGMVGGFIASVTAFSVQVLTFMPELLQWLWPSLVLVPLIVYWNIDYRRRLARGERLQALAELR